MPIAWIFFDIGNVLIDESGYTAWKKANVLEVVRGFRPETGSDDVERVWVPASAQPGSLMQNAARLLLPDTEQAEAAVEQIKARAPQMKEARKQQTVYPEAFAVLEVLSKTYKLGLIANQPVETKRMLDEAGILEFFTHANVSGDYPFQKPDPRYFLETLKDAGADAAASVFVDDNIERGLLPASKIGMRTVWFKHVKRALPDEGIVAVITNLSELPVIVKTL